MKRFDISQVSGTMREMRAKMNKARHLFVVLNAPQDDQELTQCVKTAMSAGLWATTSKRDVRFAILRKMWNLNREKGSEWTGWYDFLRQWRWFRNKDIA